MATPARDNGEQVVHFLRKTLGPGVAASGTVVEVGVIPAGAIVLANASGIYVSAQFTGTTNVLDVGYSADSLSTADPDAYASAVALPITTAGNYLAFDDQALASARARSVDTRVTATFTGTATTGAADVVISYVPNR